MSPTHTLAALHFLSAVIMLVLAGAFFVRAKRAMKAFIRISVREESSPEEDYRMLRNLVSFVVLGALFLFMLIWGLARLLDPELWFKAIGS